MSDQLKCLFITASTSACAGEAKLVRDCLSNLGITFREIEWLSQSDFQNQISQGEQYDFIYLGAHADGNGFGENEMNALTPWDRLAFSICATECIRPNGTLFLGCCRGGMKAVAITIMITCDNIDYICGPHWKVAGNDLTSAFQAFVQSRIRKKEEPSKAAERATEACGFRFSCYDRQELMPEIQSARRIQNIEYQLDQIIQSQNSIVAVVNALNNTLTGLISCTPQQESTANPSSPSNTAT